MHPAGECPPRCSGVHHFRGDAMQLDDFVAESIRLIAAGIHKGQAEARKLGTIVNPLQQDSVGYGRLGPKPHVVTDVEFDVAVTVVEGTSSKGNIGVLAIVKLGAEGKSDSTHTAVNRIKF